LLGTAVAEGRNVELRRKKEDMTVTEGVRELDARALPPARQHAEIFGTFDAVAPGEAFILLNDHEPKPLLYQFQVERPGAFEWNVLEAAPERFRVEIRRRTSQGPRAIREFLGDDHRRLDAILRHAAVLAHSGSFAQARASFEEFRCGLERHIEMEEEILFPSFEKATGITGGPTVVMHVEHLEIRRLMNTVGASLRAEDLASLLEGIREFTTLLEEHNAKEEDVLYPMADRSFGDDRERDEIVQRMQRV
jgi:uncharacterized protein (DUF2249 family)/hemerythrin-like domain-containing protein